MKNLYIKQKVFSLGEKFTVTDENQQPIYHINGSFLKIPKSFEIIDAHNQVVSTITKKVFSLLPKFFITVDGLEVATIHKDLTFFKARYRIEAEGIEVHGNWWDMDFEVTKDGQQLATIHKKWVSWGDSYELSIMDDRFEHLIVAIVVAIDRVKADADSASAASASD